MKVCLTGGTGFVGAHVARALAERGDTVRATYRNPARLERLRSVDVEPVRADVLDRAALRRAMLGCDLVLHCAGYVGSRPVSRVWEVNALAPRIAVEAAASAGIGRVVVTSSVGAIGPQPRGTVGNEDDLYTTGGLGLTYVDAKHEGEREALAAGVRLGVEVVIANPAYVLGVPVDPSQPGETSTRTVGNYLRGRLPAVVDGGTNFVDVEDVAKGHLLVAERGRTGERYVLGGQNTTWVELIDRIAAISGIRHPVAVLPPESAGLARAAESLRLPGLVSAEGLELMAQNWQYSSAKARRELGYRPRPLARTLERTVEWYLDLIAAGAFAGTRPSALSLASLGMRAAGRAGLGSALRAAEERAGRRLVAGIG